MKFAKTTTIVTVSLALTLNVGCSGEEGGQEICEGRVMNPHFSPAVLGEFRPPSSSQSHLDDTRIPYQWHLLLHAPCDEPVTIEEVCMIDGGDGAASQFVLEVPDETTASRNNDGVLRLTYERSDTHSGDDQDDIAIVVQSNADNAPTIVVPVCARVVSSFSDDRFGFECDSPVEIPAEGERVEGLCP